jgi:hypothetical protein
VSKFRDISGDVSIPEIRCGSIQIKNNDNNKSVTFSKPMTDTNYQVLLFPDGVSISLNIILKTKTGFSFSIKPSLNGNIVYLAVSET